jgi:hypothetical protein
MIGVIRAIKWNRKDRLPIEYDFNLDLNNLILGLNLQPKQVWHIGRFAIDNEAVCSDNILKSKRITILKLLLLCAFSHVMENTDNVAIAECDSKLFDKLRLFNIHSHVIGEPKNYLGSLTVPIINTAHGVREFVESNKELYHV